MNGPAARITVEEIYDIASRAAAPYPAPTYASLWQERWMLAFARMLLDEQIERDARFAEMAGEAGYGTLMAAVMIRNQSIDGDSQNEQER